MKKILLIGICLLAVVAVAKPKKSLVGARGVGNGGQDSLYDAEIEWLSSDGYSYIITDFIPQSIQRFKISYSASLYSKQCYFGCGSGTSTGLPTDSSYCVLGASGNSDRRFNLKISPNGSDWVFWCKKDVGNEYFDGEAIIMVDTPILSSGGTQPAITINGITSTFDLQGFGGNNGTADIPIAIFGRNSPTGIVLPATEDFKIRELIFFATADETELLAYYIPVRKGTTGYMYDRVTGKIFGNVGTGSFIIGPDKN